ncbi:MAG: hypothetical protein KIT11_04190 [Fimbriimonadaceae bacterium]|nr:hypothetical protein [Fimbriimonadaceae bacterium]QYK56905.1 MAG: hypothetical protein KF733_05335 [Fimbriimonadaceae bacterium]
MLAFVLAFVARQEAATVTLGPAEDTVLDSSQPEINLGRDPILVAGPGKVVLVRFDTFRLGEGFTPTETALRLTMASDSVPRLKSVRRMVVGWGEGPGKPFDPPIDPEDKTPRFAATWKARWTHAPNGAWDSNGAAGERDAIDVEGAAGVVQEGQFVIAGLGRIVEDWARHPSRNYGLRLEFEGECAFVSSESPEGPSLVVRGTRASAPSGLRIESVVPAAGDGQWVATLRNYGSAETQAQKVTWSLDGRQVAESRAPAVAPGETATVAAPIPARAIAGDERFNRLVVETGGASAYTYATGQPVRISGDRGLGDWVGQVNEALVRSRFSFAADGCRMRVRRASEGEPAIEVDGTGLEPGSAELARRVLRALTVFGDSWRQPPDGSARIDFGGGAIPDTRDDTFWPSFSPLPDFPWGAPEMDQLNLTPNEGLGGAEVAVLNELAGKPLAARAGLQLKPEATLFLSLVDDAGQPLSETSVTLTPYADGQPSASARQVNKLTGAQGDMMAGRGTALFGETLDPGGKNGWVRIDAERGTARGTAWLPAYEVLREMARGRSAAAFIKVRVPMTNGPLREENAALNRAVTDSGGRFPAQLLALVDGNADTTVTLEGDNAWLEVDLGRDLLVGEVTLHADSCEASDLVIDVRTTGEAVSDSRIWIREPYAKLRFVTFDQKATYRAGGVRARFLRVRLPRGGSLTLRELQVKTLAEG